ncbi:Ribosomal protein L11 methyltransferase [Clarias magur]|uniref:Ribosomal protein L11 methyltransferase n=1 Tax=Clarias magur TaxID=1594786 RepID=A0A8J4TVG5_CLAMG|nr:Ribosomal protein L11 methyltransferase [Clarias magur]
MNTDASAHYGFSMNYIIDCRCAPNTKCNYVMRRAKLSHYPPNMSLMLSFYPLNHRSLGAHPSLNLCLSGLCAEAPPADIGPGRRPVAAEG